MKTNTETKSIFIYTFSIDLAYQKVKKKMRK